MKKVKIGISIVAVLALICMSASHAVAGGLSSKEIKRIERGIEKIKADGRGIQKRGYQEIKKIGPSSVPFLIETLEEKALDRESRRLVCMILGEFKAEDAVPNLIATLKDKSYTVRAAACKALGQIGDPSAVKSLLKMLKDTEALVRENAVYALVSFDDRAIPSHVAKLLDDEFDSVRFAAITLLAQKLDSQTTRAVRQALQRDATYQVRQVAARALGDLQDNGSVDLLSESLREDGSSAVRQESAIALGKIGQQEAIPALIEALKDEYKDVQLQASYALKTLTGRNLGRSYTKWKNWHSSGEK